MIALMPGTAAAIRRLGLAVGAVALLGTQPGQTQVQPSQAPPLLPGIVLSPMIPYQQGIANIEAQDAARPKAVQPILPGAVPPNAPAASPRTASPTDSQPIPAINDGNPRPQ